jgi:hypothetical protein
VTCCHGSDWCDLQAQVAAWARETFRDSTIESKFAHLMKELVEISAKPQDVVEWADAFLLLMDATAFAGFTMDQIYEACRAKHAVNRAREWGEPDEHGVVEHVRSES